MAVSPVLDAQTAVLGWVQHDERLWGYVIRSRGKPVWVNLSGGFDSDADGLRIVRTRAAGRDPARPLPRQDLADLYRSRFQPLEDHLKGVRNLIVLSQGEMAGVPVEMLLQRPVGEGTPIVDWPWLGRAYHVSYAPSCTALDTLCRRRQERQGKRWSRTLLVLGDPPFNQEQLAAIQNEQDAPPALPPPGEPALAALGQALRGGATSTLPRLPGTRVEAKMIASLLGPDRSLQLLGPQASEGQLLALSRSGELAACRYVHLATHAFVDSVRPELSGLVLARAPVDPRHDGILHMREVFQLKLDSDMVVLSACQTALGRNLAGEGMVGLATAFFSAGTPSLVVSLWSIPDGPTALLMRQFYANLAAGQPKSVALSQAKKWLRTLSRDDLRRLGSVDPLAWRLTRGFGQVVTSPKGQPLEARPFAHPHYWAGFILAGDPQ